MVIGYRSLQGKCTAIPCHIQLAAIVVMGMEWAKGWGAWPTAAQVFTWMFIRLVNSDAYSVLHGLRYNITDSQVAIWILHGTISTVLYTTVLSRDHLNVSGLAH